MDRRQPEQHAAQKLARAALPGPRKRGPMGAHAPGLRARGHPLAPLSPEIYKYPPWGLKKGRSRVRASYVVLFLVCSCCSSSNFSFSH